MCQRTAGIRQTSTWVEAADPRDHRLAGIGGHQRERCGWQQQILVAGHRRDNHERICCVRGRAQEREARYRGCFGVRQAGVA